MRRHPRSSLETYCASVWLTLVLLAGTPGGALANGTAAQRAEQAVARIDAALGQMSKTSRPLQGFAAEGARVVAYAEGKNIRKIEVQGRGERGRTLLEFYWAERRLVAARSLSADYGANPAKEANAAPAADTVVEDERMFFGPARPVRWQQLHRALSVDSAQARQRAAELQGQARSFLRFIRLPEPAAPCLWSCKRQGALECLRYQCE
jgi:hypothetical protein